MTSRFALASLFLCLFFAFSAFAQSNELAVTAGGDFTSNAGSTSIAVQGSFAHRLAHLPFVSLYGELPLGFGLQKSEGGFVPAVPRYSSVFFTPGVKVKLSALGTAPYFLVGGGVAHFNGSNGAASTTSGAVGFGGGLDLNLLPLIGLRGEVRDYYSGGPDLGFGTLPRQHNVFVTGGLVLRF